MTNQLIHVRAFPTEIQASGPRRLTGRLVPYNEIAHVMDLSPEGKPDIYEEGFRPGAFSAQVNSPEPRALAKINLIHRHEGGLGYLGPFTALREDADGLYGDVNVLRSKASDVEDLLADGVGELSVEFRVARPEYTEVDGAGVRWRTRAHLDQVALEPRGAYRSAQVLAYRAEQTEAIAETEATAEHERIEAEAAAARRARWDQLAGRLDGEIERQAQLVRDYGLTRPGGYGTV